MRASIELSLAPEAAFEVVVRDLSDALSRRGVGFEHGPQGRITERGEPVGRVTVWEPGRRISLDWRPAPWKREARAEVELRFSPVAGGTCIEFEVAGWGGVFDGDAGEVASWFAGSVLAAFVSALSPKGLGDWLTDRRVRRPTGPGARRTYSDPTFHWPNFLLILDRIALRPDDRLLEVGCGGGAFVRKALGSGCRATAVDHSPDMVRLAIEQNRLAVDEGRLVVLEAEADRLPVGSGEFTCGVMTGVIGFLPDPVAALREMRRALRPGGRVAIFGATSALRGTPAAPEPYASRIHFYDREEFARLARLAGFVEVRVEEPDLEPFACAAHLAPEVVEFFRGTEGALLLLARAP
jgi:SAM-dependent methyltransferase